jgi:hypothetical protein
MDFFNTVFISLDDLFIMPDEYKKKYPVFVSSVEQIEGEGRLKIKT